MEAALVRKSPPRACHAFGPYRLDSTERLLTRDGTPVPLTPKAFDLLVVLVRRAGHLVSKDELLREVWPGTFVEEANLSYTIALVRKALEDRPEERYIATVQKLGYRFTAPVRVLEEGPPASDLRLVPPGTTAWRRAWPYGAAAASAVLVAAAVWAMGAWPRREPAAVPARLDLALPAHVEEGKEPSISPDGRSLVMGATHAGDFHLTVRQLDAPALVPLGGSDGGWLPIWSPDSRSVAFLRGRTMMRVDTRGGTAVEVCEVPGTYAGGDWNADGIILVGGGNAGGPVSRVPASGGRLAAVTALDASLGETAHRWPHFLPDGKRFIYTAVGRDTRLYVGALDSAGRTRILADARGGYYLAPGHLIFQRGKTLMAQRFDPDALSVDGDAFTVADDVGLGSILGTGISVSRAGTVVYRPAQDNPTQLFWFDRDGSRRAAVGPAGSYRQVALSPSGRQAAVSRRDPVTGNLDVHVLDLATGVLSRQTSDPAYDSDPVWAPDERTLIIGSNRTTWSRPFRKDLVTGAERPVIPPEARNLWLDDWTRDGQFLVLRTGDGKSSQVYVAPATGAVTPRLLRSVRAITDQYHVSPAGNRIGFGTKESGTWEVSVASFPDFTWQRQVSVAGGVQPLWRRDGRELFYLTLEGVVVSVTIGEGSGAVASPPQRLFDTQIPPWFGHDQYSVTADGQRFLFIERKPQTITILQHWFEGRDTR